MGLGSIPARNWIWKDSIKRGAKRHWILDDNISGFCRLNRNLKIQVTSGTIFKCAEDFVDRYENIGFSGFNYSFFAKRKQKIPPFYYNTRIYSCILIQNKIKHRWRGRYNEDTDLSLRILKDGLCTVLFNAFLCDKTQTMTMLGGNTEDLYEIDDGRLKMAQSLVEQHPDVARVSWKFGRWQHQVNYRPFKFNKLIKKPNLNIPNIVNNYGMILKPYNKE